MSISKNRFETSDKKVRRRHEVVLSVDSPASGEQAMCLSPKEVVHTSPSPKAIEAYEERVKNAEQVKNAETVVPAAFAEKEREFIEEFPTVEEDTVEVAPLTVNEEDEEFDVPAVKEETESYSISEAKEELKEETKEEVVKQEVYEEVNEMPTPASVNESVEVEENPKKKKRTFRMSLTSKKAMSGWIFVLPFVIGIIFIYAPIIWNSLVTSFSDIQLQTDGMVATWNDFGNYKKIFAEDSDLAQTIYDGMKDLILQIPAIVIFALFMAIILNQKMTGRAIFRAIFFLPVILSTGIIDTIDSRSAFMTAVNNSQGGIDDNTGGEQGGLINAMDLQALLGGIKIGTELVDYVVDLVNNIFDIVSRSGVQMLIFLSGLQSISPSIYESCEVEGASAWETFWKITLPMISPMILVNAIYTVIDAFTAADNRVMFYIDKIYNRGSAADFALSSAMSWLYVMIVLVFIVLVALIMKTVVFYQRRD